MLGPGELFWIFIRYGSDPDCYLMLFFFMRLTMKFFAFLSLLKVMDLRVAGTTIQGLK